MTGPAPSARAAAATLPAAAALLKSSRILLRRGPFLLGAWPLAAQHVVLAALAVRAPACWMLLADERELTLLVDEDSVARLPPPTACERGFSLLTLDTTLAWDAVGVLAALTAALASARVPVGALAAFSRDHLLIQAPHLPAACAALAPLCAAIDERP